MMVTISKSAQIIFRGIPPLGGKFAPIPFSGSPSDKIRDPLLIPQRLAWICPRRLEGQVANCYPGQRQDGSAGE